MNPAHRWEPSKIQGVEHCTVDGCEERQVPAIKAILSSAMGTDKSKCTVCTTPIGFVDAPTGGWWAHAEHPIDEHDAKAPEVAESLVEARVYLQEMMESLSPSMADAVLERIAILEQAIRHQVHAEVSDNKDDEGFQEWEFRLSPDRRVFAFYQPGNEPWFLPLPNMQGKFVSDSGGQFQGWTRFVPAPGKPE
jgi:hypothetical protein